MSSLQEFVNKYNGHGVDFDGAFGNQCVDLAQFYNKEVIGGGRFSGNARDIYGQQSDKYAWERNTPAGIPRPGSVVVFGAPYGFDPIKRIYYGHVAIVLTANLNSMTCLSQNSPGGTATAIRTFSYNGCIGWGTPKTAIPAPPPPVSGGITPVMRRIRVLTATLNVRSQPNTSSPAGQANRQYFPDGNLHAGAVIDVTGWQHAQNVGGNDVWLRTVNNHWIWSGGTDW